MIDFRWLSDSLCDVLHWQFANPGSEDGPAVLMAGRRLWEIPACDAEVDDCDAEDDEPERSQATAAGDAVMAIQIISIKASREGCELWSAWPPTTARGAIDGSSTALIGRAPPRGV